MLQIVRQVTFLRPRTDYCYKWAEVEGITKDGQNIFMLELGTYLEFALDPLQSGNT